jgi:hypothetical protein
LCFLDPNVLVKSELARVKHITFTDIKPVKKIRFISFSGGRGLLCGHNGFLRDSAWGSALSSLL